MTRLGRLRYWWPTLVWAAVIFWFSSRPTPPTGVIYWQDMLVKKAAHLGVYAILAVLLYRSLRYTTRLDPASLLTLTLTLIVLYAASDEFHQSFVPGRGPHLADIAIDFLGAAGGLRLTYSLDRKQIVP